MNFDKFMQDIEKARKLTEKHTSFLKTIDSMVNDITNKLIQENNELLEQIRKEV